MLTEDLGPFLGRRPGDLQERLTEGNSRRIALLYDNRLIDLLEEGAVYFARAHRIRQNREWAPNRPIRAEIKLARVNAKVDLAERTLLDALGLPPREDGRKHDGPLESRSVVYYLPILEAEADRLEAEALKRGLDPDEAGPA
jgi:hypothetical protein